MNILKVVKPILKTAHAVTALKPVSIKESISIDKKLLGIKIEVVIDDKPIPTALEHIEFDYSSIIDILFDAFASVQTDKDLEVQHAFKMTVDGEVYYANMQVTLTYK